MVEALVGTEHHSDTRQAWLHSGFVSFLIARFDVLEAVRAFDSLFRTAGFVIGHVFAKTRDFTFFTRKDSVIAFLKKEQRWEQMRGKTTNREGNTQHERYSSKGKTRHKAWCSPQDGWKQYGILCPPTFPLDIHACSWDSAS
jgi:hypothetical protein